MKPSRRTFLLTAVAAPLAAGLDPWGNPTLQAAAPVEPVVFDNPQIIRYDARCFSIHDKDTLIVSAAFHYPRCPKALWRDRLEKLKLAGFNTIESYAFWNYHEPQEGKVDLTEFEDFVKLVEEMGFMMIARPGPYVCAEWERGGFPSWVAAKRFPLRSADPQSVQTSAHWFAEVLPVIQQHQVTVGGPIIMMQVENEYDFSVKMPDAEKREYIRALAHMAWNGGINIPVFTCWTMQARENDDPDMAKIMDTCNFYPRWKVVEELTPALDKLRREEPYSPLAISELQGGWFSRFGGPLSVRQDGVNSTQINLVTKTALELGVTSFSYYMGFGGTNFDWAAKHLTTTYDYAAPIREPGGLGDKYYATRGICQSLHTFGNVLLRAVTVNGVQCSNPSVSVTERSNGPSSVLFVRENANAAQRFTMTFTDPHSPSKRQINAPRKDQLDLAPREMKMLPVQIPLVGERLCYSTGEMLAQGANMERPFLILYDLPGRVLEFALGTTAEPKAEGDIAYRYWDPEYETAVFGMMVGTTEKLVMYNESLQIFVMPRDKALRTFFWEFPPHVVLGSEAKKTVVAPVLSDAYSLGSSGTIKNGAYMELDFLPGEHEVAVMMPPLPVKCRVDGEPTQFQFDRPWHMARLHVSTPSLPVGTVNLTEGEAWVEKFDPAAGEWITGHPQALEDLGQVPYGYVKYRATFNFNGEPRMFITTRADDAKMVFVNGKLVREASNTDKLTDFPLAKYAQAGSNVVEIACEIFGAPNGGDTLGELKGLESGGIGGDFASAKGVDNWQIQRFSPLMHGRELIGEAGPATAEPTSGKSKEKGKHGGAAHAAEGEGKAATAPLAASVAVWAPVAFPVSEGVEPSIAAFTWCRARFQVPLVGEAWKIPWKVTFDADCDALLYLNGKFVGRYVTIGPQKEFYLPEPYLAAGRENVLTFALAYTDQAHHLRTLQVGPYPEYSVRRTRVEFEW